MRTVFAIHLTPEAIEDLRSYSKRDRRRVMDEIESSLKYELDRETRNNKRLRPEPTCRVGIGHCADLQALRDPLFEPQFQPLMIPGKSSPTGETRSAWSARSMRPSSRPGTANRSERPTAVSGPEVGKHK